MEPVFSYPVRHTAAIPDRIVLIGMKADQGQFRPAAAEIPSPAERETEPIFPIARNLVPHLTSRVFGVEQRAEVVPRGDAVIVRCTAGEKLAGAALFSHTFRYPRGMRGDLVIEGQSDTPFAFAVVRRGEDAPVKEAVDANNEVLARIPSSHWRNVDAAEIIATCPQGGGAAAISAISIFPEPGGSTPVVGTWIWRASSWLHKPGELASGLRSKGVTDVYLQLPIENGAIVEPYELRRLIGVLIANGLTVRAVEGDPDMATAPGRAHALERARTIRQLTAETGVRSVQYDIEPYLRPEFGVDKAAGWREWATTIRELAATLGTKIEIVVPFWMLDQQPAADAIAGVRDVVSAVAVMAYRTDEGDLEQIAESWLDWGVDAGIRVHIALENGPLPIENHRTFVRAERGEVALDRSSAPHRVLLFDDRVSDSYTMPTYSFSHEVTVPPSRVSFAGDGAALTRARDRLAGTLVGWPSFGGILIHELAVGRD